jgi:sulfite reductase beta subunit-like hemoprotein
MLQSLTLIKATPTAKKDGFILKLQEKKAGIVANAFGQQVQNSQLTYYMKVSTVAVPINHTAQLEMDVFSIDETDPLTNITTKKTIQCKWLHLK